MMLDKEDKICYVMEFKRVFERYGGARDCFITAEKGGVARAKGEG